METSELQQILDRHEYMRCRIGRTMEAGVPVGFHNIEGPKPGQKIRLNNYGTVERPDFRYRIDHDGVPVCENLHFPSSQAGLRHALDYAQKTDPRPSLRRFEWYPGHHAYAVDGFVGLDAIVIESGPGKFLLRIGPNQFIHDPAWKTPIDALII